MKKLILLLGLAYGFSLFAQVDSYNTINSYITTNVNSNGAQRITGAILNNALDYLSKNQPNIIYDTSRSYLVGQGCVYNNRAYYCKTNTSGAFDGSKWTKLQPYFDYTICNSGCDFSDIKTAFDAIPKGSSVYVGADDLEETDDFTIADSVSVTFDNTRLYLNTAYMYVGEYTSLLGQVIIKYNKNASGIEIIGNNNYIENIQATFIDSILSCKILSVLGSYNVINNVSSSTSAICNVNGSYAILSVNGDYNIVNCNIFNIENVNAGALYVFQSIGTMNSYHIIIQNNTTSTGSVYGMRFESGSSLNAIRGVALGNTTGNLSDAGTSNNVTGLIAP